MAFETEALEVVGNSMTNFYDQVFQVEGNLDCRASSSLEAIEISLSMKYLPLLFPFNSIRPSAQSQNHLQKY